MKAIRTVMMIACGVLLATLAGCLDLTTEGDGQPGGTSSSGGSTSSNGGTGCDADGMTCDACIQCESNPPGGNCLFEAGACASVPDCEAVDACFRACTLGDASCMNLCVMTHPIGADIYQDYYMCMYCQRCTNSCAMTVTCSG